MARFSCPGVLSLVDCQVLEPGTPAVVGAEKFVDVNLRDGFTCLVTYAIKVKQCAVLDDGECARKLRELSSSKVYLRLRTWYAAIPNCSVPMDETPRAHMHIQASCNGVEFETSVATAQNSFNTRLSVFTAISAKVAELGEQESNSLVQVVLRSVVRDNMFPKDKRKSHNWNRLRDRIRHALKELETKFDTTILEPATRVQSNEMYTEGILDDILFGQSDMQDSESQNTTDNSRVQLSVPVNDLLPPLSQLEQDTINEIADGGVLDGFIPDSTSTSFEFDTLIGSVIPPQSYDAQHNLSTTLDDGPSMDLDNNQPVTSGYLVNATERNITQCQDNQANTEQSIRSPTQSTTQASVEDHAISFPSYNNALSRNSEGCSQMSTTQTRCLPHNQSPRSNSSKMVAINGAVEQENALHSSVQTSHYLLDKLATNVPIPGDLVVLARNHCISRYDSDVNNQDVVRIMICVGSFRNHLDNTLRFVCAFTGWVAVNMLDYRFIDSGDNVGQRVPSKQNTCPSTVWASARDGKASMSPCSPNAVLIGLVKHDCCRLETRKQWGLAPNQLLVWIVEGGSQGGVTACVEESTYNVKDDGTGRSRKRCKQEQHVPKNPPSDRAYPLRKRVPEEVSKPGDVCAWMFDASVQKFDSYVERNNMRDLGALVVYTSYPDNPGAQFHRVIQRGRENFVPCAVIGLVPVTITDPSSLNILATALIPSKGWLVVGDEITGYTKLVDDHHVPSDSRLIVGRVVVSHSSELRQEYQLKENQVLCYVNVSNPMKLKPKSRQVYLAMVLVVLFAITLLANVLLIGATVLRGGSGVGNRRQLGSQGIWSSWGSHETHWSIGYGGTDVDPWSPVLLEFHKKLCRNYKSFHMEAFAGNRNDPGGLNNVVLVENFAEIVMQMKTSGRKRPGSGAGFMFVDQFINLGTIDQAHNNSRLLVEGDAGVGKTSFLRLVAQTWAIQSSAMKQLHNDEHSILPLTTTKLLASVRDDVSTSSPIVAKYLVQFDLVLLVPLVKAASLEEISPSSLLSLCTTFQMFNNDVINEVAEQIVLRNLNVLWLFDSVDEAMATGSSSNDSFRQFVDHLLGYGPQEPALEWIGENYIVTSQPGYFPEFPRPPIQRWHLKGFKGQTGRNQYIDTYFRNMEKGGMGDIVKHYFSVVSSHNQFGFAENPLLVQMVCYAFAMRPRLAKALRTNDQTLRTKVYSAVLTDLLFRRHLSRGKLFNLSPTLKKQVVQIWLQSSVELASSSQGRYITSGRFDDVVNRAIGHSLIAQRVDVDLVEEFKQCGLFRIVPNKLSRRGGHDAGGAEPDTLREFAHQTFLDFFLARSLVTLLVKRFSAINVDQLVSDNTTKGSRLGRRSRSNSGQALYDAIVSFVDEDTTMVPLLGDAATSPSLRSWMYSNNSVLAFFADLLKVDGTSSEQRLYCLARVFGPIQHTVRARLLAGGRVEYTPLHWAARNGQTDVVDYLLRYEGADPYLIDWRGYTPRHLAERHHYHKAATVLERYEIVHLQQVDDGNHGQDTSHHQLGEAWKNVSSHVVLGARTGQERNTKVSHVVQDTTVSYKRGTNLTKNQPEAETALRFVDSPNAQSRTAGHRRPTHSVLHIAASNGNRRQVKQILVKNPELISAVDENGATPLHAAASGGHAAIVKLLLEENADPKVGDVFMYTPLHKAAMHGHLQAVKVICEAPDGLVTLSAVDTHGYTALYVAALSNHLPVVKFLSGLTNSNVNASQLAAQKSPLRAGSKVGSLPIVSFLVEHAGADVNQVDGNGNTALHFAAKNNHEVVVEYLLAHGARVDVMNRWGASPLDIAVQQVQHEDIAMDLIDALDPSEHQLLQSAFVWASRTGNFAVIQLLAGSVDVDAKDKDGISALSWAAGNGEYEICEFLLTQAHAAVAGTSALEWASTPRIKELLQFHMSMYHEAITDGGDNVAQNNPESKIVGEPVQRNENDASKLRMVSVAQVGRRLHSSFSGPGLHGVVVYCLVLVVLVLLLFQMGTSSGVSPTFVRRVPHSRGY